MTNALPRTVAMPPVYGEWEPINDDGMLALAHSAAAGTLACTPEFRAALEDVASAAAIEDDDEPIWPTDVDAYLMALTADECADLAASQSTLSPERTDMARVYANSAGEIVEHIPDLALTADVGPDQFGRTGVASGGRAERIARYGYDPESSDYDDVPADDGLIDLRPYTSHLDMSTEEAARLAIAEGYLDSRGGAAHTSATVAGSANARRPTMRVHGNGEPIIGKDGMPVWQNRLDATDTVHYRSEDVRQRVQAAERGGEYGRRVLADAFRDQFGN